jgi:hypothetical protein
MPLGIRLLRSLRDPGESALHMALRAVAFRLEGGPAGVMAGSAGCQTLFGWLVQTRLEIQRSLRVLLEQLVMTDSAIAFLTRQMRGVIEGNIPILGHESEFLRRSFFVLGKRSERSAYAYGEKTCNDSTHARNVALFRQLTQYGTIRIGPGIAHLQNKGALNP